jgi:hypothetical protein
MRPFIIWRFLSALATVRGACLQRRADGELPSDCEIGAPFQVLARSLERGIVANDTVSKRADGENELDRFLKPKLSGDVVIKWINNHPDNPVRDEAKGRDPNNRIRNLWIDLDPKNSPTHVSGWQKTVGGESIGIGATAHFYPWGSEDKIYFWWGMSGCTTIFVAVCLTPAGY